MAFINWAQAEGNSDGRKSNRAGLRLLPVVWVIPSCDNSGPTVKTLSDEIAFDRLLSPGAVIQSIRSVPQRRAQNGQKPTFIDQPFWVHIKNQGQGTGGSCFSGISARSSASKTGTVQSSCHLHTQSALRRKKNSHSSVLPCSSGIM